MPKFDKPDSPNIIWGVNALEEDLTRPSDSKIQTGWIQEKPPYEFENYSMNKLYQGFAYYNQLGFPEWDSDTEYQAGKSYVQGSNNRVYKCIQTHTNRNPAMSGNEDWWEVFEGNRQATTTSRGTTRYATNAQANSSTADDVALTPGNLLSIYSNLSLNDSFPTSRGILTIPCNLSGTKIDLVIQWSDHVGSTSEEFNIVFPVSFENVCLFATITDNATGASSVHSVSLDYETLTKNSVKARTDSPSGFGSCRVLSIGY